MSARAVAYLNVDMSVDGKAHKNISCTYIRFLLKKKNGRYGLVRSILKLIFLSPLVF